MARLRYREPSTLCEMAKRGLVTGCVLDGPLTFDNPINPEAARPQRQAGCVDALVGRV
ncbi:MAG: hypothetical protein ABI227_07975 [Rhodanobacter sp.]